MKGLKNNEGTTQFLGVLTSGQFGGFTNKFGHASTLGQQEQLGLELQF